MKYCTNCGAEVTEWFRFCSNCGAKFEEQKNEETPNEETETKEIATEEMERIEAETEKADFTEAFEAEELDIKYEEDPYVGEVIHYEAPSSGTGKTPGGNIGFSVASMVCGIVSLLCCCVWFFSVILAVVAIVLGIISLKNGYEGKGMAIAGLVTGGITIFAIIILLLFSGAYTLLDM